jgi:hypothetical protein
MRRIAFLVLASTLAACDGSDEEPAHDACGTIMGTPFTPTDRGALIVPAATCTIPGIGTRSVAVLALGFSSFPNLCGFVTTTGLCGDVAGSLVVSATVMSSPAAGTASPIGPGTYGIGMSVDGQGNIVVAGADITKVDAVCTPDAAIPDAQSGSITIATVSPRVTGTLDVTFTDGSRFSGNFDLPTCSAAVDFCTVINDACGTTPCCSDATTCP